MSVAKAGIFTAAERAEQRRQAIASACGRTSSGRGKQSGSEASAHLNIAMLACEEPLARLASLACEEPRCNLGLPRSRGRHHRRADDKRAGRRGRQCGYGLPLQCH